MLTFAVAINERRFAIALPCGGCGVASIARIFGHWERMLLEPFHGVVGRLEVPPLTAKHSFPGKTRIAKSSISLR